MILDPDFAALLFKISDSCRETGNLSAALQNIVEAKQVYDQLNDHYFSLCCLERMGMINSLMGNRDQATSIFEELNQLAQQYCLLHPDEPAYKRLLGASFEKLGEMHASAGETEKALYNFELMVQAFRELTTTYSDDDDSVRLATACSRAGYAYKQLGKLQEANDLFEEGLAHFWQLLEKYEGNYFITHGMAIMCQFLGDLQLALGNIEKALSFAKEFNRLEEYLYQECPEVVAYIDGLAMSFQLLGKIYLTLNELENAREAYEKQLSLHEAVYAVDKQNFDYKKSVATACSHLSHVYRLLNNLPQSDYYQQKYQDYLQ
jgi:tetratricopeptide (TPR) repeat protein